MSSESLAALLGHLGRADGPEGARGGLTQAQWAALRYMARANALSRTVSALAAYQATTRGTVSQTVKALVAQGYLTRNRSQRDGRSIQFDLTPAGGPRRSAGGRGRPDVGAAAPGAGRRGDRVGRRAGA